MSSAWDLRLALCAAALAGITALFTLLIIAATDEGAPFARRLGMAAALGPIAGAVGALGAIRIAAGRGELRALAAIGADPARAARGAILGAVLIAALGPALAASGLADLGGLFPRPAAAHVWIARDGAQALISAATAAVPDAPPAPKRGCQGSETPAWICLTP